MELAQAENLLPLLVWLLGKNDLQLSQDQLTLHWRQYLQNYRSNTLLLRELSTVLGSLSVNQVECIVLKGAALLTSLYPDPGLRYMCDIDLLVRPQQLPRVIEVLQGCGYRPLSFQLGKDLRGQVMYVKDGKPAIYIEPHWSLGSAYSYAGRIDIEDVWQRANKLKVANVDTLVLSREDCLLHLCLHLFLHYGAGWLKSCRVSNPRGRWKS